MIALTDVGTCRSGARLGASASREASSVRAGRPGVARTSPSGSSVAVLYARGGWWPRTSCRAQPQVAEQPGGPPTPTTSSPVAIGSSVPAWPTLRIRRAVGRGRPHHARFSPAALSTTTTPEATRDRAFSGQGRRPRRRPSASSPPRACTGRGRRRRSPRPTAWATRASPSRAAASASSRCRALSGTTSGRNPQRRGQPRPALLADLGADEPGRGLERGGGPGVVGVTARTV